MDAVRDHRIITFYSYKGGTGRSMALANFAWIMASSGKKVLVIDWDLEAPGLHRYFRPFLTDPDLSETDGLIDCFWRLAASAAAAADSKSGPSLSPDQIYDMVDDSIRGLDYDFAKGRLDFIGAGRQDEGFSEKVSNFNWKTFFDMGGARIISVMKEQLKAVYDYVLIDSRTGVSDTAGICTIQFPDTVVACFTLNRQSIEGVSSILASIRAHRSDSVNGAEIRLFPAAMRIENAEQARLESARAFAREAMSGFLPANKDTNARNYWDAMEVAYRPAYAFEEVLSVFGDATGEAGAADTMLSQFENMARRISDNDKLFAPEVTEAERQSVLKKYRLGDRQSPPIASIKAEEVSASPDIADENDAGFLQGLLMKERMWRQSGCRWKLLLSRREIDLLTQTEISKFGRNMTYYHVQSQRMQTLLLKATTISMISTAALVAPFALAPIFVSLTPYIYGIYTNFDIMFIAVFSVFALITGLNIFVFCSRPDRPYGVSFFECIMIVLLWRSGSTIQDFEALQSESRNFMRVL